MTTSHALKYNGAPYTAEGELVNGADTNVTRGPGYAKCACGALSPVSYDNGSLRRAWFKSHKAAALAAPVQDEIPLDPEPVAEAPAEVPAAAEVAQDPEAEPEAPEMTFSRVLPFTKASPDSFWRFLGRDGVRRLAESGVLGPALVSTNASNHTLLITGPSEADVDEATKLIEAYWDEALTSAKEWKKTDATWLARPTKGLVGRKASYFMTGEYYLAYAEKFIEARDLV